MTYSHSSAMLPSIPTLHPPSPSFSPSGSRLEASAKEKVVDGVMGRRSVLICYRKARVEWRSERDAKR